MPRSRRPESGLTNRLPPPGAFFAARNTRLREKRNAGIYMRGTGQKNGREFVLGTRGTSVARERRRGTAAGGIRERVHGIPVPREKDGVYRRGRIIGDSLFLLAFSSHVPLQSIRFIYWV